MQVLAALSKFFLSSMRQMTKSGGKWGQALNQVKKWFLYSNSPLKFSSIWHFTVRAHLFTPRAGSCLHMLPLWAISGKLPAFKWGLVVICGLQATVCYFATIPYVFDNLQFYKSQHKHNFKIILFTCSNSHRKFQ